MQNKLTVFLFLFGFIVLFACSETEKKEEQPEEEKIEDVGPEMYEATELALLMRNMHEDFKKLRKTVVDESPLPSGVSLDYAKLSTAIRTDKEISNDEFKGWAEQFLSSKDWETENGRLNKDQFNSLVTNCLVCHEQYCPGPMPTIKKLYIK